MLLGLVWLGGGVVMNPEQPDDIELMEKLIALRDLITERANPLGLYMKGVGMRSMGDDAMGDTDYAVVVDFTIGDLAFSPAVQNPEQERVDRAAAELDDDMGSNLGESLRQHWIDKGVIRPRDDE